MGIGDLIVVLSLAVLGLGSAAGVLVGVSMLLRNLLGRRQAKEPVETRSQEARGDESAI